MSQVFSWSILNTTSTSGDVGQGSGFTPATAIGSDANAVTTLPRDIQLLANSNELDLTTGGLQLTTGAGAIAQSAAIRLGWWLNEWFLDQSLGIDYQGQVLVKNPNPDAIKATLRQTLLDTVGVGSVSLVTATVNPDRTLSATLQCSTDYGEITLAIGAPTT